MCRTTESEHSKSLRSLALYSFALDKVHDAVFLIDEGARFHFVNEESCRVLGYSRQELIGLSVADVNPDYSIESWLEYWAELKEHGSLTFEGRNRTKDRRFISVEISANYFEYEGQEYNLSLVRDITERKRAENVLKESQTRLELAVRSANMGIWSWDVSKNLSTLDEQTCTLLGIDFNSYTGTAEEFFAAVHPDDIGVIKAALSKALESDENFEVEYRVQWPDKSIHHVAVRGRLLRNESGDPLTLKGVTWDITAKRNVELLVLESKERFRALFAESPDAYLIMELPNGRISDCNKAAEEMLGGNREMIIGKTPVEISPRHQPNGRLSSEEAEDRIREAIKNGRHHFEWLSQRFDGTFFWVDITISVVRMAGKPTLFVATRDISERKKMEADLQEARNRLSAVVTTIPDMIWMKDTAGAYLACNPEFERLFNAPENEIIGKSDYDLVDRSIADIFHEKDQEAIATGVMRIDEGEVVYRSDGRRVILETRKMPVMGADGRTVGVLGIGRDITRRIQMEETLLESEAQLKMAMDLAKLAKWEYDVKSGMFAFDNQFYKLYGTTAEREGGTLMTAEDYARKFIPPEESAFVAGGIDEILANSSNQLEHRIIRADGEERFIAVHGEAVRDQTGRIVKIRGANQDVTERRKAEEELRKSEERLRSLANEQRTIIDTAHIGITKIQDRIQIWCNEAMTGIFGYSRDELLNMPVRKYYPSEDSYEQVGLDAYPILSEGKVFETERQMRRKDGTLVWAHITGKAINPDDPAEGSVWTFEDISERKEYEHNLDEARMAAETANRAKSDFLANMSHEIRTPLNGIIGLTHLMLDSSLNPKQRDYLAKIQTSSKSLMHVLNDILDYSKIEAGQLNIETAPFYIDKVLSMISDLFSVMAEEKGVELAFEVAPSLPACFIGDEMRLGQVLINLVGNAIKFTHRGEIHIKIEPVETTSEEAVIAFAVRDTGIGISEENLEKLFTAFTQADSSTTRKYGGTGLGLSISKNLIDLMGGRICATSTPGEGSTFSFTVRLKLPNHAQEDRDPPEMIDAIVGIQNETAPSQPCAGSRSAAGLLGKSRPLRCARVLLVEDNTINRQVAQEMLERFGLIVDTAYNGREAVQSVEQNKHDIVLMDLQMPEMDGFEATRIIRTRHDDKQLPIIAMTAAAMTEDREKCLAAGMNDHIPKPLIPDQVLDTLLFWIKPRSEEKSHPGDKPTPFEGVPFTVPGFDTEYAAACQLGNWNGVRRALDSFAVEFGDAVPRLKALLAAGNHKDARILVHSVRGSSANLGGMELSETAGVLETELKSGKSASLSEFCSRLAKAVAAIRSLGRSPGQPSPYDRETATELLSTIMTIVTGHRIVSHEMIEKLCDILTESAAGEQCRKLKSDLDRFSYGEALETARSIAEILNLEMGK